MIRDVTGIKKSSRVRRTIILNNAHQTMYEPSNDMRANKKKGATSKASIPSTREAPLPHGSYTLPLNPRGGGPCRGNLAVGEVCAERRNGARARCSLVPGAQ